MKKKIWIELKPLVLSKVRRGHHNHKSGSGIHDNRPKRQRTRAATVEAAMKE